MRVPPAKADVYEEDEDDDMLAGVGCCMHVVYMVYGEEYE